MLFLQIINFVLFCFVFITFFQFPSIIDLNVGGSHYTTHLSTLTREPESKLAAMFTGKQPIDKDKDGRYFIDANGYIFGNILKYLRSGEITSYHVSLEEYDLAVQLGIKGFVEKARNFKSIVTAEEIKKIKSWYPEYEETFNKVVEYIKIKLSTANSEEIDIELQVREDPKQVPQEMPFFIRPALEDPDCFFLFKLLEGDLMLRGFHARQTQWRRSTGGQMWRVSFSFDVKDLLTPY